MSITRALSLVGLLAVVPTTLIGCIYDDDPPRQLVPEPEPSTPVAAPAGTAGPALPVTRVSPMLVTVDADETMNATPGEGVGVFVEYGRGGKWRVWWTCDTTKTGQSCDVAVSATASSGTLSNVDASGLPGGFVTSSSASRVDVRSTTTVEVHGIRFGTNPGAFVTIEASLAGLTDGSILFFVQDGKVNGGFAGKLTNPLQFQGSAP